MDSLKQLSHGELAKLRDFYANYKNYAPHAFNFMQNTVNWSKINNKLITVFAPNGEWQPDGTIIALLTFNCYDLFIFTTDKSCVRLRESLKNTNVIDWTNEVLIYALHENLYQPVIDVLKERNIHISFVQESVLWKNSNNAANFKLHVNLNCPNGFYLGNIETKHAATINALWPYRYEGSEKYVKTLIAMNGGHAIFSQSNNELIAWVLINSMGLIGILQTRDEYKRKGLGDLLLNTLTDHLNKIDELIAIGTISMGNKASKAVFQKCGFHMFAKCYYIGVGKQTTIAFDSDYDFSLKTI